MNSPVKDITLETRSWDGQERFNSSLCGATGLSILFQERAESLDDLGPFVDNIRPFAGIFLQVVELSGPFGIVGVVARLNPTARAIGAED